MGDNVAGNDPVDRALRVFVYGPIGLACYLKDSAPTFTELFVSRGRARARWCPPARRGEAGLLQARAATRAVAPAAGGRRHGRPEQGRGPGHHPCGLDGSTRREGGGRCGRDCRSHGGPHRRGTQRHRPDQRRGPDHRLGRTALGGPRPLGDRWTARDHRAFGDPSGPRGPRPASTTADLPIAGYDGLSASQVIERLEGMSRGALERVRVYELAHRARRTILASIDNLTA